MTKQVNNSKNSSATKTKKMTTKASTTKKKSTAKVVSKSKKNTRRKNNSAVYTKKHNLLMAVILLGIGVLLTFSTYAWLSTSLNVRIRQFNMVVDRNSGLSISLDGITFSTYVEVSKEILIDQLQATYPSNTSQWAANGLIPVSTNGASSPNNTTFDVYASSGVRYRSKKKEDGYVTTYLVPETQRAVFNSFISFDIFLKNITGSPVSDNIYFDQETYVRMDSDSGEEMEALVNSARIGFLKMGSVANDAAVNTIQSIGCNNDCQTIIYEPNSLNHNELSIERALKYGINLVDGQPFSTYANIRAGGPIYVKNSVSGSTNLDLNYFGLQNTITEDDFVNPLFQVPNGITKVRVYIWIEGQDIDSLETDSEGADISISIDFTKDTWGYEAFDE